VCANMLTQGEQPPSIYQATTLASARITQTRVSVQRLFQGICSCSASRHVLGSVHKEVHASVDP